MSETRSVVCSQFGIDVVVEHSVKVECACGWCRRPVGLTSGMCHDDGSPMDSGDVVCDSCQVNPALMIEKAMEWMADGYINIGIDGGAVLERSLGLLEQAWRLAKMLELEEAASSGGIVPEGAPQLRTLDERGDGYDDDVFAYAARIDGPRR